MALKRAQDLGQTQGFKFEKKGDVLKGYYIKTTEEVINGSRCKKHFFHTKNGIVTVLGQANMYKQLTDNNCQNLYVEVTFTGQKLPLKGGKTMKIYSVDYDETDVYGEANSVETQTLGEVDQNEIDDYDGEAEEAEAELEADEPAADEVPPARQAQPPKKAAQPASKSHVQNLLASRGGARR